MRKGHLRVCGLLVASACASGKPMSAEQVDSGNPDQTPDAKVFLDAPPQMLPDAKVWLDAPAQQMPDACVPAAQEKLVNPVFDLAPAGMGWVDGRDPATNMLSGGPFPIISANPTGVANQSNPYKAWLGGAAGQDVTPAKASLTDTLHQDVAIPAMATNVVVSGYYLVGTNESGSTIYDRFTLDLVQTNGTLIENVISLNNTTNAGTFTFFTKTITANVAGQTVRLRATSINDSILHTNFFLDSFSLKATHCP